MGEWREVEFGKIPKEWDLLPIINLKSDEKHSIAMGPFGSNIKSENFVDSGVPVIRGNNFNFHKYISGDFVYLTEGKANELKGSICRSDDLVFTHRGTIGQVGLIPKGPYTHYVISQSGMKLTVNQLIMDPEFLLYFLISRFGQYQILKYESQVGVPSISNPLTSLKQIEVPVPPLPEQKAIASVLSSLDDKIDLLHSQNKTLEAMAETLFRQWFDNYETKEHTFFQLKDLVKQVKPGTNYQPKRIENGIPFLNVRNLSNGFIDKSDIKYISDEEHSRVHKAWKPEENDILISRIGTLGVVALIRRQDLPIAVHYNMLNIKAKKTSHQFLYYLLKSKYFQSEYDTVKRASVQEYVAVEDAESIEIPLPSSQEQMQYLEEQIASLFAKTLNNYNQIRTLEKLHDILLPKLMSGEVRIEYEN